MGQPKSQPRIHRLRFQSQHSEGAFVHPVQRIAGDEAFHAFDSHSKFSEGETTFPLQTAGAEEFQVAREGVLGAVDNAQVLASPAFNGGLKDAALFASGDELARLDDHTFSFSLGFLEPPIDACLAGGFIV